MDRPAFVSLTFDDGLRCQFERAVPILDQYGFPSTFFLVANNDPIHTDGCKHPDWRKTDWSDTDIQFLKSMIQRGHEIGAHSVHHRHPFLDRDPKAEAEGSKQWIESRLEVEVPSYCYPFFHLTPPIKNAVINAGYKQARWGANRTYHPEQRPIDFYQVDSRLIAKDNPEYVVIDGASHPLGRDGSENVSGWLQPGWYVLTFHGIGTINDGWFSISLAEFTRQMTELKRHWDSGAVEIVTFKDGADRLRQS
jgi:peptidoglycan/xylan/chitin deacetylase (PgdA/CDA1 family)